MSFTKEWWQCSCCTGEQAPEPYTGGYYGEPKDCDCCGGENVGVVVLSGERANWFNQPCNPPCEGMIDWAKMKGEAFKLERCFVECASVNSLGDMQLKTVYVGCDQFPASIQRPPNCGDIVLPVSVAWVVTCTSVFGPSHSRQKKRVTATYSTGVKFQDGCPPSSLEPAYFNCSTWMDQAHLSTCVDPGNFVEPPGGQYPYEAAAGANSGINWRYGCGAAEIPFGGYQFTDPILGVSRHGITRVKVVT